MPSRSRRSLPFPPTVLPVLLVLFSPIACSATADPDEAGRLATLLQIQPGQSVADVGAGDGEWAEDLADRVGPEGQIYATEVGADLVEGLRERAQRAGLVNMTALLGDQKNTGLPESCCDGILVRMVYHHFTDPTAMRRSLARALRPDGHLLICDIEPHDRWGAVDGVPDRGGHGIAPGELVLEMAQEGFHDLETQKQWNGTDDGRYCVLFSR